MSKLSPEWEAALEREADRLNRLTDPSEGFREVVLATRRLRDSLAELASKAEAELEVDCGTAAARAVKSLDGFLEKATELLDAWSQNPGIDWDTWADQHAEQLNAAKGVNHEANPSQPNEACSSTATD